MKKVKYFLGLIVAGAFLLSTPASIVFIGTSSILFTSCDTNEGDTITPDLKLPIISYNPPAKAVFDVAKGEVVNFRITAKANDKSNKDLATLKFHVKYSAGKPEWDTTWQPKATELKQFIKDFAYTVPATLAYGTLITITISGTDVDAKIGKKVLVLTVVNLTGLNHYETVTLGAQANPDIGSFYASSTNLIYKVADAKANGQSTIDLIYIYNNTYTAAISGPDDTLYGTQAKQISVLKVHEWTTRNATRFKSIPQLSLNEWEALTSANLQQKWAVAGVEGRRAAFLFDGTGGSQISHVLFKTSKNKVGIFKVKAITGYDDKGSITLNLKIQK